MKVRKTKAMNIMGKIYYLFSTPTNQLEKVHKVSFPRISTKISDAYSVIFCILLQIFHMDDRFLTSVLKHKFKFFCDLRIKML